ncbi:hypothetical protein ACR90R_23810 [Klebsiella pneumoniae]|mgnify:CR=1 FL=1|jgi:hypothetical protein|uniref:hypothetical protein n=1 Tax=Klebsiella pneumoniae complex TaxID=3390273 RepID=UPI00108413E4|nr:MULTISPECIES: hypothetical protein [Klebsiella]DAT62733.1 MAG TPA: hypothetical protein [Caudoviricetes sp.]HCD1310658.1 hypothetical protein [Klebsiella pneumoniae subsp. pneumoniae]HCI6537799.1 hypothetical protein [Klebsiella variicola subsp. variicola]HDG8060308.1 hypothetical protein [Klebsiella quasipneumoniae subsp. similipneumoniae]MBC5246989.1 hypothetical protein [Klebsiella pneumoniae]
MNDDKKSILTNSSGITTGGLGAVLTTLVPLAAPETDSVWRPFLYALAPLISAFVTYFMVWVINRHGLESPAEASLRNRLERDLKGIDKQLESQHITEKFRQELILDREVTVRKIVNIGKNVEVTAVNISDKK